MRIANRTIYHSIDLHLSTIARELKQINEQVGSSKRINRPSDDPIGMAQALRLKKVISQVDQYNRNLLHGESWLKATESALDSVNDLIVRAKEIANQMATGTYNADQRTAAAKEIQNILEQTVQIGNTRLNGLYIFSGYRDDTEAFTNDLYIHLPVSDPGNNPAYTGTVTSSGTYTDDYSMRYLVRITSGGAVGAAEYKVSEDGGSTWGPAFTTSTLPTAVYSSSDRGARIAFTNSGVLTVGDQFTVDVSRYNGDQHEMEIAIGHSARMRINLTGEEAFGAPGEPGANIFDTLVGLVNGLENNDIPEVQSALENLNTFEARLLKHSPDIGSRLNRIEVNKSILDDVNYNYTQILSGVEDTDAVRAIAELNAKQAVYQAALYVSSQIAQLSLVDYMP